MPHFLRFYHPIDVIQPPFHNHFKTDTVDKTSWCAYVILHQCMGSQADITKAVK